MDCRFYDIKLDKSHVSRIKWNKSKRLLYGSLLCLSQDDFETLYFAVIEKADHEKVKNEGILRIKSGQRKWFTRTVCWYEYDYGGKYSLF